MGSKIEILPLFEDFDDGEAKVSALMDELEKRYPVDLWLSYNGRYKSITLSRIVIKKENRNKGTGTNVMNEICEFADQNNYKIVLSPSSDFGGSKSRLFAFYHGFGFKKYKGYDFRESMIREPNVNESAEFPDE